MIEPYALVHRNCVIVLRFVYVKHTSHTGKHEAPAKFQTAGKLTEEGDQIGRQKRVAE